MVLEGASSYGATEEGGGGGGLPLLHSDPRVEGGPAAANSGCVKAAAAVALSVFAVGCIVVAVVSVSSSLPGGWPLEKRAAGLNRSPFAHNGIPTPEMPALSTVDPKDSGFPYTDRPETSRPSNVWGRWLNRETFPKAGLATNAWWQNIVLGFPSQQGAANKVVALPYTLDASGTVPGLRVHFPRVNPANDRIVQTEFDWRHALQLGSVEPVGTHMVDEPGPLSVTLVWETPGNDTVGEMRSPIVRGSPYITMEYSSLRPMVMSRQEITKMIVDGKKEVHCGGSGSTVHIEREAELVFSGAVSSDYTWLLFVSEPMDMKCSMEFLQERGEGPTPGAPGEMRSMPHFKLAAESVYETAVLRTALVNNCTMGTNLGNCEGKAQGRNQTEYAQILRENYMLYPTGESRVGYESSGLNWAYHEIRDTKHRQRNDDEGSTWGPLGSALSTKELKGPREDGSLYFMWGTRRMDGQIVQPAAEKDDLLMFSLPHHREALSDAKLLPVGTPTLHGFAQLVKGVHWAMSLDLAAVSFGIQRDDLHQPAMTTAINEALDKDIMFEIPDNYKRAAGDTYFSGKMLAKLGRIALIADALGRHDEAMAAAKRLTDAIDVWYDGTAEAPLLYDFRWGGIVSCGCDYKGSGDNGTCANSVGAHECPGLSDPGSNFGAGFYNDQHFHYGKLLSILQAILFPVASVMILLTSPVSLHRLPYICCRRSCGLLSRVGHPEMGVCTNAYQEHSQPFSTGHIFPTIQAQGLVPRVQLGVGYPHSRWCAIHERSQSREQ
jgi:hypothetical protein